MAKASIITIGDELLIGQVVDTNSSWIATELNKAGIGVLRRVAIGDDANAIIQALDRESADTDVVLITGGLGPTADDITKPTLCKYFECGLITHEPSLARIRHLFEVIYKRPLLERNIKQAEVPSKCTVIENERGTAPGMWFEKNGKIFISMPGIPHEMKGIMEQAIPLLKTKLSITTIHHRTLVTSGIGESALAEMIMEFENSLPPQIKLAYLPRYGMVRLRLSASGNEQGLESDLNGLFIELQKQVSEYLVTNIDEPMEAVLGKLLLEKGKTLCTAESCTGGYISQLITSIPGASGYYEGSFIAYSYAAKERLLRVKNDTLVNMGAVSEEVVMEMAKGALENIRADYVIAVSGIMGPEGGTPDKPVGTVWLALGKKDQLLTHKLSLRFDRKRNMEITALQAMNLLRQFIMNDV